MQEFDWRICAHALGRGRERKGEACLLTLHLLELDIRTPGCGLTRGRDLTRGRGGARCATGKNGGFPLTILKPRVEGYQAESGDGNPPKSCISRSRKPRHLHAKTQKHLMHLLCGSSHGGWQRQPRWMIAEDKLGQNIATTKGNVTASWRQRNLRSGWRVRQYELTTWLRQRRRRAISQWIGVILYGFRHRSRSGRFRCVQRSDEFTYEREPILCLQTPWKNSDCMIYI